MKARVFLLFLPFLTAFACDAQLKTVIIQSRQFTARLDESGFHVTNEKGDTVVKRNEQFFTYKFEDFNRDGRKDILLDWGGNTGDMYDLYLFDSRTTRFRNVKNFSDHPAPLRITGTPYYYSYRKSGCADMAWVSDLFLIKNYVAIKKGRIRGDECGVKDGIYIYRSRNEKLKLIQTLKPDVLSEHKDYKWGFIKAYWTKHFAKFL